MIRAPFGAPACVLASALLAAGCSGGTPTPETQPRPQRYSSTEADARFMSDMIAHHGQALVMAGWAPTHGASPAVQTLAERIVSGQQDEIALMQRWLRDRGAPADTSAHSAGRGGAAHAGHAASMPGMLTRAQLDELDRARGPEFDRLFLKYMIQHHQGALTMVNRLFATPEAAQEESTFKLANDVSADQSSEITRMERMLAEVPAAANAP